MFIRRTLRCAIFSLTTVVALAATARAEMRTWSDASGKFNVEAEFVAIDGEKVILRNADGKEIKVPLDKLSEEDQQAANELAGSEDSPTAPPEILKALEDLANEFYEDLRTTERTAAAKMLTADALKAVANGPSPVKMLPKPDRGKRTLRPGEVLVDGDTAEVPMRVKAGGKMHDTKLHFRNEEDVWRVFAISATFPDGEKTINFEAPATPQRRENPLEKLVGQEASLQGYTLDGSGFDLEAYKGKVVLIDFWATWCGPCRAEIPNILANWERFHDAGFEVVAVSVDRDLNKLQEFVAEENPPWTVVADNHPKNRKSMAGAYGVSGIPAFILVDQMGKVVSVNCRGKRLGQELGKWLQTSGKEIPASPGAE